MGMRRSGNHAVIHFLRRLYGEQRVIFLNNRNRNKNNFKFFDNRRDIIPDDKSKVDTMIVSYEDLDINNKDINFNFFSKEKFKNLKNVYFISIIRDPFNMFASRYRLGNYYKFLKNEIIKKPNKVSLMWKGYARRHILIEGFDSINKNISINYNNFISSKKYRREISSFTGCDYVEKDLFKMTTEGRGSSFNENNINVDNLLKRWEEYRNDKYYMNIFKDKEIIDLSRKIFGDHVGGDLI